MFLGVKSFGMATGLEHKTAGLNKVEKAAGSARKSNSYVGPSEDKTHIPSSQQTFCDDQSISTGNIQSSGKVCGTAGVTAGTHFTSYGRYLVLFVCVCVCVHVSVWSVCNLSADTSKVPRMHKTTSNHNYLHCTTHRFPDPTLTRDSQSG